MILRDEVYANTIINYIDYFRKNKKLFSLMVQVEPGSEVSKLPQEAYRDGFLYCTFDFSAKITWIADQIKIEDNMFSCILVYAGAKGWEEYPVSFPIIYIIGITKIEEQKETIFNVVHYSEEFQLKIDNSKKHLKFPPKE